MFVMPNAGGSVDGETARVIAAVLKEHRALRPLLDEVEQAAAAAREGRPGGLDLLHTTVWDLYLAVEDHLFLEEKELAPILDGLVAMKMILEHNEQRAALLELVEDSEAEIRPADELAAEAIAFVVAFRIDMDLEERGLATLATSPTRPSLDVRPDAAQRG